MTIVDARCAICGKMIQIPDDTETCFCMYCGNKMLTEAAVKFANIDKRVEVSKKEDYSKDFEIRGGVLYKYLGDSLDVVIPDTVRKIEKECFKEMIIESVVIPGTVREIGYESFYYCKYLKSVDIKDGVTQIGSAAFIGCSSLTSITIPDSVTQIGENAFKGCQNLIKIITNKAPWEIEAMDTPWGESYCKKSNKNPSEIATMAINTGWGKNYCKEHNLCQYCGGTFKGVWKLICTKCGKPKDY